MEWYLLPNDSFYAEKEIEVWNEMNQDNRESIVVTSEFYKGTTGKKGHNPARWQILHNGELIGDVIKCRHCEESGTLIAGNIYDVDSCPSCGKTSK